MTVGLIILGVAATLIFFGAAEKYFEAVGVTSWLTFLIILSLVLGALIPDIKADSFSISVGGFIVPFTVAVVLAAVGRKRGSLWRVVPAIFVSAAITAGLFVLMDNENALSRAFTVGVLSGAVAVLIADSRINLLVAAIGGLIIGDVVAASIAFARSGEVFTLGSNGIFDALIISCAFGLIVNEVVGALRRVRISKAAKLNLNTEAARDENFGTDVTGNDKNVSTDEKLFDYLDE